MKDIVEGLLALVIAIAWIAGMVLAKGFLWKMFAFLFPPYAWYKFIEAILRIQGWI